MKHDLRITFLIIAMFVTSMLIGLLVISSYDRYFGKTAQKIEKEAIEKNITIEKPEISVVKEIVPEPIELKRTIDIISIVVSILIAILLAVALFFLFSKVKIIVLLKGWFAVIIFICLAISFSLVFHNFFAPYSVFTLFGKKISPAEILALPIALILTFWKVKKRNLIAHNISELFVYPGLAVIFVPILNVLASSILLILISIYDMVSVWKTKHMQAMAKFQIHYLKIFSGFFLPYASKKDKRKLEKIKKALKKIKSKKEKENFLKKQKLKINLAILGGGDVAFPMIFVGTVLLKYGLTSALTVIITTAIALTLLLFLAKKGKFYPAMPFLSLGCFFGLFLLLL
ncbi:MAG: presenilin family intramembrane aspartyl protease [Candidatus Pacearchaeota archaeon]|nr:presenilin family intramembrane aspartyl protease [Candidatus Pacearchaeota archaeon]